MSGAVGDQVEKIADQHGHVVAGVVDTVRPWRLQRPHEDRGKVVGVDVIAVDIVFGTQCGQTFRQALQGQAVGRINAGHPENHDLHPMLSAPLRNGHFSIQAPLRPGRCGIGRTLLVDPFAGTIPVHTTGRNVDESLW